MAFGINLVADMESTHPHDRELDACGLNCPLPILRTKKALNEMRTGSVLKVLATDPAAVKDFQAFSRQTGNALIEHSEADGIFLFFLRRK
jgi:tRNA 2-thiouridine synthesizing protein A